MSYEFQRRFNAVGDLYDDPEGKSPTEMSEAAVQQVSILNLPWNIAPVVAHASDVAWSGASVEIPWVFDQPLNLVGATPLVSQLPNTHYWVVLFGYCWQIDAGINYLDSYVGVKPYQGFPPSTHTFTARIDFPYPLRGTSAAAVINSVPALTYLKLPFGCSSFRANSVGTAIAGAYAAQAVGWPRAVIHTP